MSEKHKGKKLSPEHCKKLSRSHIGKKLSFEHRKKLSELWKGEKNPRWRGGKRINETGYISVLSPKHPFCNSIGYIKEHRLVVEKYLGRYLTPKECCHHLGIKYPVGSYKNKGDNRPENLMAFKTQSAHNKFEKKCEINKEDIVFDGRI